MKKYTKKNPKNKIENTRDIMMNTLINTVTKKRNTENIKVKKGINKMKKMKNKLFINYNNKTFKNIIK